MVSGIKSDLMKPLIMIPSPRDLPEFKQAMDEICEDKVWAKYMKEKDAYACLQKFFLEHQEYDYGVIIPDDLIVNRTAFKRLRQYAMTHKSLPVLAGVCNLSYGDEKRLSCCLKVSGFQFITNEDIEERRIRGIKMTVRNNSQVIRVGYEGFSCSFIQRKILEKIPLEGMNDDKNGHFDWAFSLNCYRNNIPIHVYLTAKMQHLRFRKGDNVYENFHVGEPEYPPELVYTKYNTSWKFDHKLSKHITIFHDRKLSPQYYLTGHTV